MYTQHRMMKMVRRHLDRKYVVQEEELLERIAESTERGAYVHGLRNHWWMVNDVCMCVCVCAVVQLRRNPPSPLNKGKRKSAQHEKHSK